jgi:hypothetical protein
MLSQSKSPIKLLWVDVLGECNNKEGEQKFFDSPCHGICATFRLINLLRPLT